MKVAPALVGDVVATQDTVLSGRCAGPATERLLGRGGEIGDHKRGEMRNVHEVRFYRSPGVDAGDPAATLDAGQDALVWEPNHTAAANEDHKGYHALLDAFLRRVAGKPSDAPDITDGVRALEVLEAAIRSTETGQAERVGRH